MGLVSNLFRNDSTKWNYSDLYKNVVGGNKWIKGKGKGKDFEIIIMIQLNTANGHDCGTSNADCGLHIGNRASKKEQV